MFVKKIAIFALEPVQERYLSRIADRARKVNIMNLLEKNKKYDNQVKNEVVSFDDLG
jgi:hypothetical protein